MGATNFSVTRKMENRRGLTEQKEAEALFNASVDEYEAEYGGNGYTGTIAEKRSFRIIGRVEGRGEAMEAERKMLDAVGGIESADGICGKYGPAAAIIYTENGLKFIRFFGFAAE